MSFKYLYLRASKYLIIINHSLQVPISTVFWKLPWMWLLSFLTVYFQFKQVKLLKAFPFRYWGTMLACVMAALQSAVIGVCIDSSKAAWRLEWNLQLITIVYSVRYSEYLPPHYSCYVLNKIETIRILKLRILLKLILSASLFI